MDVFAHPIAERRVDELMLPHFRLAPKERAHDDGFEVSSITAHFDVVALQALFDACFYEIGIHAGYLLGAQLVTGADESEGHQ